MQSAHLSDDDDDDDDEEEREGIFPKIKQTNELLNERII